MKRIVLALAVAGVFAGCGHSEPPPPADQPAKADRLAQGDRVVLIDPTDDKVFVDEMPGHVSANENIAAGDRFAGTASTEEMVAAGTSAKVVSDTAKGEEYRDVKVSLLDPPYAGLTGVVKRKYLKRESAAR